MLKKVSRKKRRRLVGISQPAQSVAPGVVFSFDLVVIDSLIVLGVMDRTAVLTPFATRGSVCFRIYQALRKH
jgi:hypothetical protein